MPRRYLNLFSLMMLAIFMVSNTGFTVFRHICNTSQTTTLSLFIPGYCGMEMEADDCCTTEQSTAKDIDDCCDQQSSFAKFQPDAKLDVESLLMPLISSVHLQLPILTLTAWQPTFMTEALRLQCHPPDPQLHSPPSISARLAMTGSMLC